MISAILGGVSHRVELPPLHVTDRCWAVPTCVGRAGRMLGRSCSSGSSLASAPLSSQPVGPHGFCSLFKPFIKGLDPPHRELRASAREFCGEGRRGRCLVVALRQLPNCLGCSRMFLEEGEAVAGSI